MSLRLRLILAVGAVALVALVGVDVAVYSAFRSSLISALDERLAAPRRPIAVLANPNGPGPGGALPGGATTPPTTAIQPATGSTPLSGGAGPTTSPRGGAGQNFCVRSGLQLVTRV